MLQHPLNCCIDNSLARIPTDRDIDELLALKQHDSLK
jgi:hypothetical protein